MLLFLTQIKRIILVLRMTYIVKILAPLGILMICGTTSAVLYGFDIARWIWSLRNWGRLFVYFLIVLVILRSEDCDKLCAFVVKVYHLNFVVILVQFLFMRGRYGQDDLNGLFGRDTSSIHVTVTLIVLAITTAQYVTRKITFKRYALIMIEVFVIACIAEFRVIPILVVLLYFTAAIATYRFTDRTIIRSLLFIVTAAIIASGGAYIMGNLYPNSAMEYSVAGIIKASSTEGGYGYSGGIDRLTFVSVINEVIFQDWRERIIGIGIGNAEYSAFSVLRSPFYNRYGMQLSYLNFSSAMLYIESGLVGLISYACVFIGFFRHFYRKTRFTIGGNDLYNVLGCELAVINFFYIFYCNLQRTDASYILGFYLAVAMIGAQERKNLNNGKDDKGSTCRSIS